MICKADPVSLPPKAETVEDFDALLPFSSVAGKANP
jgi:hypothetical protein